MAEIAVMVMVVVGGILLVVTIGTLRVVIRDDPGKRPTREIYDTRRPE